MRRRIVLVKGTDGRIFRFTIRERNGDKRGDGRRATRCDCGHIRFSKRCVRSHKAGWLN